jgi:predicted CXXCH cytochrome family protein
VRKARPFSPGVVTHAAAGVVLLIACAIFAFPSATAAQYGINSTKHNLSVSGPGPIKATSETRICIFCHTPHNATPSTPLWNKSLNAVSYVLYSSSTMSAVPSQPEGPSRLCLSCHDGTLALGAVLQPAGGLDVSGQIAPGMLSYLGTVLSGDHPFSFPYGASALNPYAGLSPTPPLDLVFFGIDASVECSTCHDAHEDAYRSLDVNGNLTGKFLVVDNRSSGLCLKCHNRIVGWSIPIPVDGQITGHQSSSSPVNGVLPISPRQWPTWSTVGEWGCEECHVPHGAGGQQRLLYYQEEEKNCYTCHNGTVAQKNIYAQFQKFSRHPVEATTGVHDPKESPISITSRHVECVDCHNPHAANNRMATAPNVPGSLDEVSGMTIDRAAINPAAYEYQICFKCHADLTQQIPYIPRVINNTNCQATFSPVDPSFHPVAAAGRNPNVPSIPSTYEPTLTASSIIYCSDCHGDDNGQTRGPHGSAWPPILKYEYETADGTPENAQNYALCYYCHNRTSILNDQSFPFHNLHIAGASTPCSVCHDAHGIADDGLSGSHTHLINFDTRVVSPQTGSFPFFTDKGTFHGSCTLICHGHTHTDAADSY